MTASATGPGLLRRGWPQRTFAFLWLAAAFLLTACNPTEPPHGVATGGLAIPVAIQTLPPTGQLTVAVFMDDETAPRYSSAVDSGEQAVEIRLDAPEGEHRFAVVFLYIDPEFSRADGKPWELARWTSDPVSVAADQGTVLNISNYVYPDSNGDGQSDLQQLIARSDPAAPPATGGSTGGGSTGGGGNTGGGDTGGSGGDDGGSDDGGDPGDDDQEPEPPEGIWLAQTPGHAAFAILHAGRIAMTVDGLIYTGSYAEDAEGKSYQGSVDVFNAGGAKVSTDGPVALGARRVDDDLTLTVELHPSDEQQMQLVFEAAYDQPSSLQAVAQFWSHREAPDYVLTFPVASDGRIGGNDSRGCRYQGSLSVPDEHHDIYGVVMNLKRRGCGDLEGDGYSGYASLFPDGNTLVIIASNDKSAFVLSLDKSALPLPAPGRGRNGDDGDG